MSRKAIYEVITTTSNDPTPVISYSAFNLKVCRKYVEKDLLKSEVMEENGLTAEKHPGDYVWSGMREGTEIFRVQIRKIQILKIN